MSLPEYGSASVTSHTVFSAVVPEPAEATIDPYFFLLWLKGLKPKEIVPLAANMTFQQFVEPAKHDESSIRVTTTLPLAAGGRARTSTLSSISASGGAHLSASSRSAILRCIQAEVRDQLHTFRMLEEFLVEPSLLQRQSLFCISSEVQQDMIAKYYSFDTSFMRLMLGRKPSSKIRKELDDISEKTGIRSSSCQRQIENLRRVDHACEMTDALAQAAGAPTGSLNASERSLTPKRTSVASDSAMALPDPSFSLSASSLGTTGMQSGTIGRGFKWSVRGSILSAPGATGSAGAASNAHGMGVRKPVSASVRRANLQAKQIHLAQRQDDEALGAFISRVFCLPLGLALRYARLVFLARYRLDTLQKKLLSLSYEDFDELTDLIMREWGLPSPQEDNLDFKFLEDLKTLKTDLCSDGNTMSEYAAVVSHLLANQAAQQPQSKPELRAQKLSKLNLSRFSSIVKALVAVAVELTRRGELRDLFVDINDSVVHLFSRLGWTRAESDALLVMLARGAGELQALRDKPRVVQLWARYLRVVRPVAVLLLERSLAPKSRQSVMRKQGRASEVDVTPPVSAFVQEYVGERKEVSALDRDSAHPSTDTLGAEDTHGHRMTYGRWLLPEQLPSAMQSDDDAEFDDVRHDFQEAVRDVSAGGVENEARQFDGRRTSKGPSEYTT